VEAFWSPADACEFACVSAFARPVVVLAFDDVFAPDVFRSLQLSAGFQVCPPLPAWSDAVFAAAATHCPNAAFAFGLGVEAGWTLSLCPFDAFDEPVVTPAVAVLAWLFAFAGRETPAATAALAVVSAATTMAARTIMRVFLILVPPCASKRRVPPGGYAVNLFTRSRAGPLPRL
jgi:hypothetical protein